MQQFFSKKKKENEKPRKIEFFQLGITFGTTYSIDNFLSENIQVILRCI